MALSANVDPVLMWWFSFARHGYVRATNGAIVEFNVLGGGTGANQGTFKTSINTTGAITGSVTDLGGVFHGYVRK